MNKIYIVSFYSNYGWRDTYEPTRRAFTSEEDVLTAIFKEIKGDESSWVRHDLNFYRDCSYGDYKYITEEISTTNWK